MSTNAAAVAGVACLVLALGVGVLIGGIGNGDDANAAPQIITVGGAAPAAAPATAAPTTAAPESTTAPQNTDTTAKDSSSKDKSSSKDSSSSGSKATNNAVKDLDKTSGGDYSKKSEKLPKQLGTGGKAPPKDNKPAAGGSDFQDIG
jgi:hypothetical protein